MINRMVAVWMMAMALGVGGARVEAQQRPLQTEDPETVGEGIVLIEAGFDYLWDQTFTVSGLRGDLLRMPLAGVSIGIGRIAELQIDGGLRNRLTINERLDAPLADLVETSDDTTTSVEDVVIGTKVRIMGESPGRPAVGVRLATRLPMANTSTGLGPDTMDFYSTLLLAKTVQSIRIVGNFGVGILADPTQGDRQDDVLLYGVSLARALAEGVEIVTEINGRANSRAGGPLPGAESRAQMRIGARYTYGVGRFDGAVIVGMTTRDPSFGIAAGYTHVFRAFGLP